LTTPASIRKQETQKINPKANKFQQEKLKRNFVANKINTSRNISKTDPDEFDLT
jgi:hypothetical protein